ncbi:MAG TPA: hypothetical protein VM367_06610 [Pseudonocardia sp.]|nr:hypothetical protein [Pseudonocardia sp.]
MAATALVALPVAPAVADPAPPPALDGAATGLGGALGTDVTEPPQVPAAGPDLPVVEDAPAPATAEDLVGLADVPTGSDGGATRVVLAERNGSGVSGEALVDAERVIATATGMDPGARYVSFFYGATSSASNDNPCILDGTNPVPGDQTVGEWEVDGDGNGTLRAGNPLGERYLLQAGTMSVRKVEHDFSTATALPVNPLSYSLVACGEVQRIDALDPVTSAVPRLPKVPSLPPLS